MCTIAWSELTKEDVDVSFMQKVTKADWLCLVGDVLQNADKVALSLASHSANVLIYCGRGNGVTPLLASLAQLFMEPFYRTFDGFRALVHKEWVYYAHDFQQRN